MKTIVWAALQSMSTLEVIDRMLPDLVDESELDRSPGRYKYRRGLKKAASKSDASWNKAVGISLIVIGSIMLIPGPSDLAFAAVGATWGMALAGPIGGIIGAIVGVILAYAIPIALITIGTWMLTW